MFKRVASTANSHKSHWLNISIDGMDINVREGETVAAAVMLLNDSPYRRTLISGAARAPYCLMGVCFECLVTIDGVKDRQACMVQVAEGMVVQRQLKAADIASSV